MGKEVASKCRAVILLRIKVGCCNYCWCIEWDFGSGRQIVKVSARQLWYGGNMVVEVAHIRWRSCAEGHVEAYGWRRGMNVFNINTHHIGLGQRQGAGGYPYGQPIQCYQAILLIFNRRVPSRRLYAQMNALLELGMNLEWTKLESQEIFFFLLLYKYKSP